MRDAREPLLVVRFSHNGSASRTEHSQNLFSRNSHLASRINHDQVHTIVDKRNVSAVERTKCQASAVVLAKLRPASRLGDLSCIGVESLHDDAAVRQQLARGLPVAAMKMHNERPWPVVFLPEQFGRQLQSKALPFTQKRQRRQHTYENQPVHFSAFFDAFFLAGREGFAGTSVGIVALCALSTASS